MVLRAGISSARSLSYAFYRHTSSSNTHCLLGSKNVLFCQNAQLLESRICVNANHCSFSPRWCFKDNTKKNLSAYNHITKSFLSTTNIKDSKMPSVEEEFRHLDYEQLLELRKKEKNTVLIDVREKHELDETGVLPDSHHIPLGEVNQALGLPENQFKATYNFAKPKAEDQLIFSCRSGRRSMAALEQALAQGFVNAKHYKGGWLDWEQKTSESK